MNKLAFIKKRDVIIIGVLLLVALGVFLASLLLRKGSAAHVEVMMGQTTVLDVKLNQNRTITVPGRPKVKLEVKDGAIAFIQSDCPDQVCVHTGQLREAGDFAACLPNQVLLFVKGDDEADTVAK